MSAPGPFRHGVASGDPLPDGVVLWTRVTDASPGPMPVRWVVSRSPDLGDPVAEGEVRAAPEQDHTVKVDVRGLAPATTYHYRFRAGGDASPVGRTRTAPSGATPSVRLGVVSCANWAQGLFTAYRHLAARELDLVVHLGDYLYEDGASSPALGREHRPPARLRTLADYRTRHAQYRTDPDLQCLHSRHPVAAVWDDHDVAGNCWRDGAAEHDPDADGPWDERRAAAVQAFLEWLPVRAADPARPERIYRSLALGDLARLILLDTRLEGRDRPAEGGTRPVATIEAGNRSLLGDEQRAWLRQELREPAVWRLVGSQVVMAPLRVLTVPPPLRSLVPGTVAGGAGVNAGQWDGYPAERRSLLDFLGRERIGDVVVLSGDLHSSWGAELSADPAGRAPPVAVEVVTPSITSRSFADQLAPPLPGGRALLRRLVARQNRHVRYLDLERHGYLVVDVDPRRVEASWWHVDGVDDPAAGEHLGGHWLVRRGAARLVPAPGSSG